jgi:hypothetical protein
LKKRLVILQWRYGGFGEEKISPCPGIERGILQPVVKIQVTAPAGG